MTTKGRYKKEHQNDGANEAANKSKLWNAEFSGFVNFTPSQNDKERYVAWVQTVDAWEEMEHHAALGRKITFQEDARGEGAVAMCMERDRSSVNAGKIASVRGKTVGVALTRLLFMISDIFPNDWTKSGKMNDDDW